MQRGAKAVLLIRYTHRAQRRLIYTITCCTINGDHSEMSLQTNASIGTQGLLVSDLLTLGKSSYQAIHFRKLNQKLFFFLRLISEADDCSGGSNKWQNQKNWKEQECTVEGKDGTAAITEMHPQGGNVYLGSFLQVDKVFLRTF